MEGIIQLTPLLLIYALSAVLMAAIAGYGYRQYRAKRGQRHVTLAFIAITGAAAIWALSRMFELLFVSETLSLFWLTMIYVGYGGSTMGILFFGLAFTGRHQWFARRRVTLLLVIPTIAILVAATNWYHGWFWAGEFVERSGWWGTDLLIHEREFQTLFKLYLGYTVGGAVLGLVILLRHAINSPNVYRRQTIAFGIGAGTALLVGILFGLERQPFVPQFIDLTTVGFTVAGCCFGFAIFRHRLLDIVPVARDTVIESMRDGFIVLDTDGRIVDFNDAAREIITAESEIIGKSIEAACPECGTVMDEHEPGMRTEREIEVTIDGEQRYLVINITTLFENERSIGHLLLLRDVTERRAVQKRYQALIENSSDVILVIDPDDTITYASPSVEKVTGVEPDMLVGEEATQFIHEDDLPAYHQEKAELLEAPGETSRFEYRTMDAAGNWLYMEASVWNLLDDPFVEGVVLNAREITERKKREEELKEANEELERANEQLEQFASVISHDLRNPINVAKGHLELAEETGREESFEKIDESLERMEAIIDDVLELARQGESIGETERVELRTLATTAWDHVATDGATLEVADDLTFEGDPDRLMQLFENLFRNAHEHVGENVTVTVGAANDALFVEDDGPGIPADRREKVLESGHTTNRDGTGLGLSIVAQIAHAHGWEIEVTEGTTGGARFEFHGVESRTNQ